MNNFNIRKGLDDLEADIADYPLHMAAFNGDIPRVSELVENEARVDIPTKGIGVTALSVAAFMKHNSVVQYLRDIEDEIQSDQSRAYTHTRDNIGRTPIHYAVLGRETNVLISMVKNACTCSPGDDNGKTPLHYAVIDDNLEMVESMLMHGAFAGILYEKSIPPFLYAIQNDSPDIAMLLIQHGAYCVNDFNEKELLVIKKYHADNNIKPDLNIVKDIFDNGPTGSKFFKFPKEDLDKRRSGSINNLVEVDYQFGIEDGIEFLEYYEDPKIAPPCLCRIYSDGRVEYYQWDTFTELREEAEKRGVWKIHKMDIVDATGMSAEDLIEDLKKGNIDEYTLEIGNVQVQMKDGRIIQGQATKKPDLADSPICLHNARIIKPEGMPFNDDTPYLVSMSEVLELKHL